MSLIPEHKIQEIVSRVDIVEIISSYVTLKKKGSNYFGLSPFTNEKTPSFSVSPSKGFYHCFSSGKSGNALTFLMQAQGLGFREALELLASKAGISLEENLSPEELQQQQEREAELLRISKAAEYYEQQAQGSEAFSAFLESRGLSPETAKKFRLGIAPDDPKDLLRGRAVFPVFDLSGKVRGFGGRALQGEDPKYLNSGEKQIKSFDKSSLLYGLFQGKREIMEKDFAILTEGYIDVLQAHQAGIEQAVAPLGTALSSLQARILKRFCSRVLLVRDSDKAGLKAMLRDIPILLAEGFEVGVFLLPDGQDLDDFIKALGPRFKGSPPIDFFRYANEYQQSWIDFMIQQAGSPSEPAAKGKLAEQIAANISLIPHEIVKELTFQEAAEKLGLDAKLLSPSPAPAPSDTSVLFDKRPFRRKFQAFAEAFRSLGIKVSHDFEATDRGFMRIRYFDLKGNPYKIRRQKKAIEAERVTDAYERPQAVYLPPLLRLDEDGEINPELKGKPLFVVYDEISAFFLSAFGLLAVGINDKAGFLRPSGKGLDPLIKQVIEAYNPNKIIYLLPGEAWSLPPAEQRPGEPLFAEVDAAAKAQVYRDLLVLFNGVLNGIQALSYVVFPKQGLEVSPDSPLWVEELLRLSLLPSPAPDGRGLLSPHAFELALEGPSDLLEAKEITFARLPDLEELLKIQDPQTFFDFHGLESLGQKFRFKNQMFEVELGSGKVTPSADGGIDPDIKVSNGVFWARQKGNAWKEISNFTLSCELEIKDEESFNIYTIKNAKSGASASIIIPDSAFTDRAKFWNIIRAIPQVKPWYWGSSQNLIELQQAINFEAPEAESLSNKLGLFRPYDMREDDQAEFFVFGNGIVSSSGDWIPADDKGLLTHNGKTFFLPAFSSIKTAANHEATYQREIAFSYKDSGAELSDWLESFLKVHKERGHIGFWFYLAALNRDLIVNHFRRFPHLFLLGQKGTGKGILFDSLSALFGEVLVMNLNDDPTPSAFRYSFCQYSGAFTAINEVNPSSVKDWQITGLKGPYDNQTRLRMDGPKSKRIDFGEVTSAAVLMGQESSIYQQEAVNTRCIILEFSQDRFSPEETRALDDLRILEKDYGLCHLTAQFFSLRKVIREHFKTVLPNLEIKLRELVRDAHLIDSRLFYNYAAILTPFTILLNEGLINYPLSLKEALDLAAKRIEAHAEQMISKGLLDILFDFIEAHYMSKAFDLNDNDVFHDEANGLINIQLKNFTPKFQKYLRLSHPHIENSDKGDIKRRLSQHPAFIGSAPVAWLGFKKDAQTGAFKFDNEGKPLRYRSSAYQFDSKKLGLDLSRFVFPWDDEAQPLDPGTAQGFKIYPEEDPKF